MRVKDFKVTADFALVDRDFLVIVGVEWSLGVHAVIRRSDGDIFGFAHLPGNGATQGGMRNVGCLSCLVFRNEGPCIAKKRFRKHRGKFRILMGIHTC